MAEGHRKRLRERFLNEDIDGFPEHVVLEMMLHYSQPRCDTNAVAHKLIEEFGSLAGVVEAPAHELEKINGMGEASSTFIKLLPKFYMRYQTSKAKNNTILNTTEKAGDYLINHFIGRTNEVVFLLCMDVKCKVLCCKLLFEGNINSVQISARKIIETALQFNSARIILAHNHISGNALPSDEDLETTKKIRDAADGVGITLDDHIIVADDDYVSLADNGFFRKK